MTTEQQQRNGRRQNSARNNQSRLDGFLPEGDTCTPTPDTSPRSDASNSRALITVLNNADPDTPWREIYRRWQQRAHSGGGNDA